MTTVTPSDQAGAASAKRPATIPTQRSDQPLRLLVLGTGEGAAVFRARAAEAGAELAQRFSVRVTHVVVADGVGDEDARVVRARTAGLPVLGLAEGAQLIKAGVGGGEVDDGADMVARGADADADARKVDEELAGRVTPGENAADGGALSVTDSSTDTDTDTDVDVDGSADVGGGEGDGNEDADADAGQSGVSTSELVGVVSMVRPRTEFAPEPADGGPSDVFTGSALEAMLQFPPLPTDEFDDATDVDVTSAGDQEVRAALMSVTSAAYACADGDVDGSAGTGCGADMESAGAATEATTTAAKVGAATTVAGMAGTAELAGRMGATTEAAEIGSAGTRAAAGTARPAAAVEAAGSAVAGSAAAVGAAAAVGSTEKAVSERSAAWTVSSVAWALVPFVSLGLLTPVAIGYAAYRLRSRNLALATAGYSIAVVAAFAVSAVVPVRTGSHGVVGDLLTTCLAAAWLGGTVHSFLIRRRVFW